MKFREGKARPALRPDKSAVLNVTEVKVNIDVQNSIPSSESACLVRQTFTFYYFFVSYLCFIMGSCVTRGPAPVISYTLMV